MENSPSEPGGRVKDDDLDTRTGYDAQMTIGAVRANRLQFGMRLLIGEDAHG